MWHQVGVETPTQELCETLPPVETCGDHPGLSDITAPHAISLSIDEAPPRPISGFLRANYTEKNS